MAVHDTKPVRLCLFAALAVAASPAVAAPRCGRPCRARTAACIGARCAGLAGESKRTCVETCRGIGGCAPIRTLAYVVNELRSDGRDGRQALLVRRGNCAPVTVMELPLPTPPEELALDAQLIPLYAEGRLGHDSVLAAFFQRLAVTPDGSGVVFEVTDDAVLFPIFQLSPDIKEGFYYARTDGRDRPRRIGPQSGLPRYVAYPDPTNPPLNINFRDFVAPVTDISPSGRTFVFADWGPGPAGERAIQIVTLDIPTRVRTVLAHRPA